MTEKSFKELLQEFTDSIVDNCEQAKIAEQLGVDYEQSPDVNILANKLLTAFNTRLAVQTGDRNI